MTDIEIIKALECCMKDRIGCNKCPLFGDGSPNCWEAIRKNALDLINRQKVEIERLKEDYAFSIKLNGLLQAQRDGRTELINELDEEIDKLNRALQTAKSEAIKEFVNRAEELTFPMLTSATLEKKECIYYFLDILNEVKAKMEGDDNA